jgi:hypothetical protein
MKEKAQAEIIMNGFFTRSASQIGNMNEKKRIYEINAAFRRSSKNRMYV